MTSGDGALRHTVAGPLMLAAGNGFTLTMTEPDCNWLQVVDDASCTLINVYVNVPAVVVGAGTVAELPLVVVTV